MRSVVVAVVMVSACSSSNPVPPAPPVVANTVPAPPDPHASREGLVKETFAALAAGDARRLAALADTKALMGRVLKCEPPADGEEHRRMDPEREAERVERRLGKAAQNAKGLGIEVLAIDFDEKSSDRTPKGTRKGSCDIAVDVIEEKFKVKLRITRPGGESVETTAKVRALVVEGRWYVIRLPDELDRDGAKGPADMVAAMEEHADKACACADKACANKVDEDYRMWVAAAAKRADPGPVQDKAEADRFKDAATRYITCLSKVMSTP
jgi:hypothetical protein